MSAQAVVLVAVAALLAYAILRARQGVLMLAVLAYAGVVAWIIRQDMGLLMMALGVAIALGILGLGAVVWRVLSSQGDADRHMACNKNTSRRPVVENIGS